MSIKRLWPCILLTGFVSVVFIDSAMAAAPVAQASGASVATSSATTNPVINYDLDADIAHEQDQLADNGFSRWHWMQNDCDKCELVILPIKAEVRTKKVGLFIQALAARKADLQELYGAQGSEYNLLAQMAVGILGRESRFFTSARYTVKETAPGAIRVAKIVETLIEGGGKTVSANSRGPTQIKIIPAKITKRFGITPETLHVPENAAIATMGYLIEALAELKRRIAINHLDYITPASYADYLPYLYFGQSKALVNRTATPERNRYVQTMKHYMSWVQVYERAPQIY